MTEKFKIELSEKHLDELENLWVDNLNQINNFNKDEMNLFEEDQPNEQSTFTFRKLNHQERIAHLTTKKVSSQKTYCAICLDLFEDNQTVYSLDCRHNFHKECIDSWFRVSEDLECPLCRESNLYEQPVNRRFKNGSLI